MIKKKEKQFNYAVGHYWEDDPKAISTYMYGNDIFYGTMKNAEAFLKYVKRQDKKKPKEDRHDWKIFKLVEVRTK